MYIFLSPDNRPQTQNVRPESLAIFPNYQPGSEVKKFPDHQCWNEAKNVTNLDFLLHYAKFTLLDRLGKSMIVCIPASSTEQVYLYLLNSR